MIGGKSMSDLISRQGVVAWLDNIGYLTLAKTVMDEKRFPSVKPEQRRGHWERNYNEDGWKAWYECTLCGKSFSYAGTFCPNCGAKMKEGD
jgi:rubrerythrin